MAKKEVLFFFNQNINYELMYENLATKLLNKTPFYYFNIAILRDFINVFIILNWKNLSFYP